MPIYRYKCTACGDGATEVRPLAQRNESGECEACGAATERAATTERGRFYLKSDGTQSTGWASPGMSGIDYNGTGPDGTSGTHLRQGY